MKITLLSTAFSLAVLLGLSAAQITLQAFPNALEIGETYILNWTAKDSYGYDIWLIRAINDDNEFSWTQEKSLARNITFPTLTPSFPFTVPDDLSFAENYGLWLYTVYHGEDYDAQTAYFDIIPVDSNATATASSTPSMTNTPTSSATHTGTSSAASSTPTSDHHKSISGGAIAGIVIGCLILLALIFGGALLFKRQQKTSGVKKREAEARANRLAPVMEAGSPSFEMHGRSPQMLKETSV